MPTSRSEEEQLVGELLDELNERVPLLDGFDLRAVWTGFVEAGLHAVLLEAEAEAEAGLGFLAAIAEGLGAGLNADAFVWGGVAVPSLLAAAGGDDDVASRIVDGALPTVAMHGPGAHAEELGHGLAVRHGDVPSVSGVVHWVPFGPAADVLLAVARDGEEFVLVEVRDPAAVSWTELEPFDLRSPLAHAALERVPVRIIGPLAAPFEALLPVLHCQAAALAGSARRAVADAVEYSRLREQFGVPIATFQAVRHRLAETLLELELMRAAQRSAARSADRRALLLAAYHCLSSAVTVARANIQVHGGIGYTWEHTAHRHYRYAFTARESVVSLESLERLVAEELTAAERRS